MQFNSVHFILFFPIVICLYYVIPDRIKNLFLLFASYYFYMSWNAGYLILIMVTTIVTFLGALIVSKARDSKNNQNKQAKIAVILCVIVNLGLLFYFKYSGFALNLVGALFNRIGIMIKMPVVDIILPVGISFYTFQALGYVFDVYRGDVEAETNILRYALFVSFFPQLVAGPIERSGNLLSQLIPHKFDHERFGEGFILMLWGFFLKVVIADRAAILVNTIYGDRENFGGCFIIIAAIAFSLQIYCDFMGYSVIARGAAEMLGIALMDNFNAPFLSQNVAEFWRNWHISLTTWFRDYLYFPLGGSRRGLFRKCINIMIVFLTSGLWHGANMAFVIWGGLNGIYQVIGEIVGVIKKKICAISDSVLSGKMHSIINTDNHLLRCVVKTLIKTIRILCNGVLVGFAFIFFRAGTLSVSRSVIHSLFTEYNYIKLFDGESIFLCGLDKPNFMLLILCVLILLVSDILKKRGIVIRKIFLRCNYLFKLVAIPLIICMILLFGVYGPGYSDAGFIYFQF